MQSKHARLDDDDLIPVGEAADLAGVSSDTLRRWEKAGRIPEAQRTPTGHRRFRVGDIRAALGTKAVPA